VLPRNRIQAQSGFVLEMAWGKRPGILDRALPKSLCGIAKSENLQCCFKFADGVWQAVHLRQGSSQIRVTPGAAEAISHYEGRVTDRTQSARAHTDLGTALRRWTACQTPSANFKAALEILPISRSHTMT